MNRSKYRILITSGGTVVPIDPVRLISNNSTGSFGSSLARAALEENMELLYLVSKNGHSPFSSTLNFYTASQLQLKKQFQKLASFSEKHLPYYREYRYHNFDEYSRLLQTLIVNEKPDIVILAAAVSDYLIDNYSEKKIRLQDEFSLQLKPAPKLIQLIKKWSPSIFLVGFKLLINASDSELLEVSKNAMKAHGADLLIANNLSSIQQGQHEILVINSNGTFFKCTSNLAQTVIHECLQRVTT